VRGDPYSSRLCQKKRKTKRGSRGKKAQKTGGHQRQQKGGVERKIFHPRVFSGKDNLGEAKTSLKSGQREGEPERKKASTRKKGLPCHIKKEW